METQQRSIIRRERERMTKRDEIMLAARQVFAKRGYESATLDEIAEKAEFAKGTLYNYFDSKETLYREIVENALNDVARLAGETRSAGTTVREQFHAFALRMMQYYKANEDLLRILTLELNRIQLERELAHMAQRAKQIATVLAAGLRKERNGLVKENPVELANIFIGMVHDRVMRRVLEKKDLSAMNVRKEAALVVRLFFEGAALP